MKTLGHIIVLAVLVAFLAACGGGGQVQKDAPSGVKKVYQPDWWMIQHSPDFVSSFGMSEPMKAQSLSADAAKARAMQDAAMYIESYVKSMIKNYIEEAGVENPQVTALTSSVVKVVAEAKFTNAQLTKIETNQMEDGRFQTWARYDIPKNSVNKNMLNQIKNEEALYSAFKASQAFGELEQEIEKNK